ncbi:MAG: hypothetical protein IPJ79_16175 [Bacteroidetes bacterium]|nr:hypothetical protein [Bacteroidota bacterium]
MEENKKLNTIFEQARKAEPVVGFDEVAARFKSDVFSQANNANEAGKAAGRSGSSTWIVVSIIAAIAIGAGAWFMSEDKPLQSIPSAQTQTSVTAEPQATTPTAVENTIGNTSSGSQVSSDNPASENTTEQQASNTEITVEKQPLEIPGASTNKKEPKSKEEEALFAAGGSKNAPPPPIYKKVDGYENKSKTEVLTNEAKVTSKTKVGNRKSISLSNSKGNFKLNYVNGQLESLEKNGEPVLKGEWGKYADLIEQGDAKIAGGSTAAPSGANDFTQAMIKEMAKDNLFDENTRKVTLTQSSFTINDAEQTSALHKKYLDLYKKINGEDIGKNTVKFKR